MYFPYLYGRMGEMRALGDAADFMKGKPLTVLPVIEPVVAAPRELLRTLEIMRQASADAYVIINPHQHQFDVTGVLATWASTVLSYVSSNAHVRPTFEIRPSTTVSELQTFASTYTGRAVGVSIRATSITPATVATTFAKIDALFLLHASADPVGYSAALGAARSVEVRDSFRLEARNADYSGSELFTTAHHHFRSGGRPGYSDYTVLPGVFRAGGGPIGAAAIHLTFAESDDDLWVEHYISDETQQYQGTQATKWREAMAKAEADVAALPGKFDQTPGLTHLRQKYAAGASPSPLDNKRHQISHHIVTASLYV